MEKLKIAIMKFLLNKYAMGYIVQFWNQVKGYKTQICLAICAAAYIAEKLGYIDHQTAEGINTGFGGAGFVTFMQKLSRYQPIIDETLVTIKTHQEDKKNEKTGT